MSELGFFGASVRRPIGLGVTFLTLIVVGVIAYTRIPLQLLPSGFAEPGLNLWIPNDGSSARENEEKVARPIEEQLRTMTGLESVRSFSAEGYVWMGVEFAANLDLDLAKAETRDRLERARPLLPDTVGQIEFWSEDADQFPIAWFGILNPGDSERTDFLLESVIRPRLEAVAGVSKIDVYGILDDSVRILLDEDAVRAGGLDVGSLIQRLSNDNFAVPLGEVDDGGRRILLRSDMRFSDTDQIEDYPIGNGLVVGDVGRVIRAKSVRDRLSRIDGEYAYFGVARKASGVDVVESSRALEAAFDELELDPRLDGQFTFLPFFLQGRLIENSLAQLRSTAVWGGALALVVLLLFLRRIRLTLCVALSIPTSALLAIAWEYFGGGSFNLLTMTGITLGIGMLVDNSVVMVENIARHRAKGLEPLEAASRGAGEIALAVTLATSTTVVVFLPLIFMNSNPAARILFGGIGIPLCLSLLFSLAMAVVFLPVVAARIQGPRHPVAERVGSLIGPLVALPGVGLAYAIGGVRALGHVVARGAWTLARVLLAVLAPERSPAKWISLAARCGLGALLVTGGLRRSASARESRTFLDESGLGDFATGDPSVQLVLAIVAAAALVLVPPLIARRRRTSPQAPTSFVPTERTLLGMVQSGIANILSWALTHRPAAALLAFACFMSIQYPAGRLDLAAFATENSTEAVEYWVRFDADFTLSEASEQMEIHEAYVRSLQEELGFAHWSCDFSETRGNIGLYWEEPQPPKRRREFQQRVKEGAPRPPGHRLRFADTESRNERSATLARFELRGPDSRVLEQLGSQAATVLARVEGLENVSTPVEDAPDQVEVRIDRDKAAQLGVTSESALTNIAWALRGWPLPRFQDESREIPLVIEYDTESVAGFSTLRDLEVWTGEKSVSLASISELDLRPASTRIYREDGHTNYTLTAEVDDPARLTELTAAGYEALAALELPRGFSLGLDDSAVARGLEEAKEMQRALWLSVVLVFLLMGILFESTLLPLSVLLSIPFAIMGAFWTIYLTGTTMDLMGWIGLIILAGVVVNNGIVLIDRIHRLRAETGDRSTAVLQGTRDRVRPVLMTALTTVFGLMPMILSEPPTDSIDYRALGTIVAGGLIASTLFTLWVVPLAYTLLDDLGIAVRAAVRGGRSGRLRHSVAAAGTSS